MLISPTLRSDLGLYPRMRGKYRESVITLTSCSRTWVGILIGDFDEWVVRISTIIDWIRDTFKMRVGVHGLKYMKLLYGLSRVYSLFSILCGLIIFEYTDSNIFLTYGMVEM